MVANSARLMPDSFAPRLTGGRMLAEALKYAGIDKAPTKKAVRKTAATA
jgi:hypothetical protein